MVIFACWAALLTVDDTAPLWSVKIVKTLIADQIVPPFPDVDPSGLPMSRYQAAVATYYVTQRALENRAKWLRNADLLSRTEEPIEVASLRHDLAETRAWFLRLARNHPGFNRLSSTFTTEMVGLGVEMGKFNRTRGQLSDWIANTRIPTPGEALHGFPDVPTSHWSQSAIVNLRDQGILNGYPDGAFRG